MIVLLIIGSKVGQSFGFVFILGLLIVPVCSFINLGFVFKEVTCQKNQFARIRKT